MTRRSRVLPLDDAVREMQGQQAETLANVREAVQGLPAP
jgi:hypothetical protein